MYTFISDRYFGLLKAIQNVLLKSYHSYCLWHLKLNLMNAISSMDHMRKFIIIQFNKLAYAPTHNEFQEMHKKFIKVD